MPFNPFSFGGTPYNEEIPMPRFRNRMVPEFNNPILDQYNQHVQNIPVRQDYAPSKLRRIGAALAGLSAGWRGGPVEGITASEGFNEIPYQRALQDWSVRGKGLQDAAGLETRNIQNENTALRNYLNYNLGNRRVDATVSRNEVLKDQGQQRLEILKRNSDTAATRIQQLSNGEWIKGPVLDDGSGMIIINNKTGEKKIIDADLAGDAEKFKRELEGKLKVAGVYAGAQNYRTNVQGANAAEANRIRELNTGGQTSVAGENLRNQQQLQDMASKNPGWMNKWIKQRPTGQLYISPPSAFENDVDPEELEDYNRFYGEYQARIKPKAPAIPRPNASRSNSIPSGMVQMVAPDGTIGLVPKNRVAEAIRDGLREVK